MMGAMIDLTGQRFGRLVVVEAFRPRQASLRWRCRCDCGGEATVMGANLTSGNQVSCGCYRREMASRIGRQNVHHFDGKRNRHEVTYQGRTQSVTEWANELKLPRARMYYHLNKGLDLGRVREILEAR